MKFDPFTDAASRQGFRADPAEAQHDLEHVLLQLLETHSEREVEALASYERMAQESAPTGAVQYLLKLIVDDEQRHHRVFDEMANELKSVVWELDVEPRTPAMIDRTSPELLAETERLLAFEKDDAKELRRLRKLVRQSPKGSLQPLLVDMMLRDTEKHIAILEFLRDHLKER